MFDLKRFSAGLRQRCTITDIGILEPPKIEGTTQDIRHLSRLIPGPEMSRGNWFRGM